MKSPHLAIDKFLDNVNNDVCLIKLLAHASAINKIINAEFYDIIDYLSGNIDVFVAKNNEARIEYLREYFEEMMKNENEDKSI